MKTRGKKFRLLSFVLSLALLLTMVQLPSMTVHAEDGVGAFVNRCYQVTLGREADPTGFADWTNQLTSGQSDGAFVAYGFVFSPEYTNKGKTNEDYVTDMYTLFLGRTPDASGFSDWVGQLNAGADRQTIFAGFANSTEFYNICASYGVTAGVHNPSYDRVQVNNVNMFVARMYKICLNRLGDQGGQADWVNRLLSGQLTGIDCANGFINSQEYQNLNLSNSDYVKNLYRAFMGREYDENGYQDWVGKLNAGYTRDEVFAGFANSAEFQSICDRYGINRGSYTATKVHQNSNTENGNTENGNTEMPTRDKDGLVGRFRIKKEIEHSGEYTEYTYNGATKDPKTITYFNSSGLKYREELYTYDASGFRTKYVEKKYNSSGKVTSSKFTDYVKIKSTANGYTEHGTGAISMNGKKVVLEETTYQKYNGKYLPVEKKEYNQSGKLKKVVTSTYDSKGNMLTETTRDANGNLDEEEIVTIVNNLPVRMEFKEYNDGKLWYTVVEELSYNEQGGPIHGEGYEDGEHIVSLDFVLDKNNNPVKMNMTYHDPDGTQTESVSYVLEAY